MALKEQQDVVDKIFLVEATTTHKAVSSFDSKHKIVPFMKKQTKPQHTKQ